MAFYGWLITEHHRTFYHHLIYYMVERLEATSALIFVNEPNIVYHRNTIF